jgi:V/A-type H+-transporting ATPase subunit I
MTLKTTPMQHLLAVVLDADASAVTKELLRQGVLHFAKIADGNLAAGIDDITSKVSRIGEIRQRIETFTSDYSTEAEKNLDISRLEPVDLEQSDKILDRIGARLTGIRARQKNLQGEILKLKDIRRQLELFGELGPEMGRSHSFLSIQIGSIPSMSLSSLESGLRSLPSVHVELPELAALEPATPQPATPRPATPQPATSAAPPSARGRTNLILISLQRDARQVDQVLEHLGWSEIVLSEELKGAKQHLLTDVDRRLGAFREDQRRLQSEVDRFVDAHREDLMEMRANLRMNELYYTIQSNFSKTARTVMFSGWLPASKRRELGEAIRKITKGRCYLEWREPEELPGGEREEAPVQMKNPRFLAPFQMLVSNYAIPEYGSIDPTPIVAITYLAMFGLMFGDAGQGLVLVLLGFLGSLFLKPRSERVRNLAKLIGWCGLSSILMGILFGSYFGMPWLPALWFDYHGAVAGHGSRLVRDVNGILLITVFFGISVISLGLLVNWINLAAKRAWLGLIFDKGGLLGGWIFGGGVYAASVLVRSSYRQLPPAGLLFWLVGLPALVLVLRPFLAHFLEPGDRGLRSSLRRSLWRSLSPVTLMNYLLEWLVELLEIFSGYLANTLSFMRVAGLGIAHVSLMAAFFDMAATAAPGGAYNLWSFLILAAGNMLVIALEGLSAGIQSLRLNYYEFFSKYFMGAGRSYMPVSLQPSGKDRR